MFFSHGITSFSLVDKGGVEDLLFEFLIMIFGDVPSVIIWSYCNARVCCMSDLLVSKIFIFSGLFYFNVKKYLMDCVLY
jgi:hypothetical protein